MTEITQETIPTFINPDGKEHQVIYNWSIGSGSQIKMLSVRIVSSNNERLEYMAINPTTRKEVMLGATHWANIYRSLLNKEPPFDLDRRVDLYYKIRAQKSKERAAKNDPLYSPFDEPEQIAA